MSEDNALRQRLRSLPPFAGGVERLRIEPLPGGLTNRSYKLSQGDQRYALRLPGSGTDAYIDRRIEAHNAAAAARLGINAELLYAGADGVLLSRYLDGEPLSASALRQPETLAAAVELLRRLHRSGAPFRGRMRLFPKLDQYLALAAAGLAPAGEPLLGELLRLRRAAEPLRLRLRRNPEPPCPCHIDPAPQNFYAAGGRLYLLDWEYSALCEPAWDLAALALEAKLDDAQTARLLVSYYATVSPRRRQRFNDYRRGLLLLAAAWAAVRLAGRGDGADFRAYIETALARYRRLANPETDPAAAARPASPRSARSR